MNYNPIDNSNRDIHNILNTNQDLVEITYNSRAEVVAQLIYQKIIEFQASLPDNEDVIICSVNFDIGTKLFVENIGYIGYNLIWFLGKDNNGKPLELIQHIHQLNFQLSVYQKPDVEVPKRKIGFLSDQ